MRSDKFPSSSGDTYPMIRREDPLVEIAHGVHCKTAESQSNVRSNTLPPCKMSSQRKQNTFFKTFVLDPFNFGQLGNLPCELCVKDCRVES